MADHAPQHDSRFRADIEGLRAVAVLLTVLFHAGVTGFAGGFVGVDVFFVVSGFLITGLLMREVDQTGTVSLREFYARRARRLLPMSAATLALTALGAWLCLSSVKLYALLQDIVWSALFAANFRFGQAGTNYFHNEGSQSAVQHFWSLAVEEQFYLVWPIAIIVTARLARRLPFRAVLGALTAAGFAASILWSATHTDTWGYFSPVTRAWELLAGAAAALLMPVVQRHRSNLAGLFVWIGLGVVLISAMVFDSGTAFPGVTALLPVLGTVLVVLFGGSSGSAERLLGSRPMRTLGGLSYGWYLLHWPAIVLVAATAQRALTAREAVLVSVLALGAAWVLQQMLENPVRRSVKLQGAPWRSIMVGLSSVALIAGAAAGGRVALTAEANIPAFTTHEALNRVVAKSALGGEISPTAQRLLLQSPTDVPEAFRCGTPVTQATVKTCIYGDKEATETMVLFGDSHAAMWQPALERYAVDHRLRLVSLTKPGCPYLNITAYNYMDNRIYTECDAWRPAALEAVEQLKPKLIVLASALTQRAFRNGIALTGTEAHEAFRDGAYHTLSRLQRTGADIVVIGGIATLNDDPAECLERNSSHVERCAALASAQLAPYLPDERAAAEELQIPVVPVAEWLCSGGRCPAVVGDIPAFYDPWHLSTTMTTALHPLIARYLPS